MSKIAKFCCEMLLDAENIALQSLQILYTFVLRAEIATIFSPNVVAISKFAKFARLYVPHFATKICNFTNFRTLFQEVYFFFAKIKQLLPR
jgi:hypothetical protein